MMQRLCTASEIQFYAANIMMGALARKSTNFVTLNKNCNLSYWGAGCDPGWACTVGKNVLVDLKNIKEIPARTDDCQPCCEGFFCPHGLTCMLRKLLQFCFSSSLHLIHTHYIEKKF